MDHADDENAERASEMATPLPKGIVQISAATKAAKKVKKLNLILDILIKATLKKNIDSGKSTKNATDA